MYTCHCIDNSWFMMCTCHCIDISKILSISRDSFWVNVAWRVGTGRNVAELRFGMYEFQDWIEWVMSGWSMPFGITRNSHVRLQHEWNHEEPYLHHSSPQSRVSTRDVRRALTARCRSGGHRPPIFVRSQLPLSFIVYFHFFWKERASIKPCLFTVNHSLPIYLMPKKRATASPGRTYIFWVFFIKTPTVGAIRKGPKKWIRGFCFHSLGVTL